MLEAYHRASVVLSGVTTTKDFSTVEPALSWLVDYLTRNPTATASLALNARYLAVDKTTVCDRQLSTNAFTLTNIQTCP